MRRSAASAVSGGARRFGNIVTEDLVFMLEAMGIDTGIDLERLLAVRDILREALPGEPLYGFTPDAGLPLGFARAAA
jgi:hydroxymethylglutaryl-CoA lyase